MKFKSQLATVAGRTSQQLLKRFTSGGTSLPGKIAQKIDPEILKALGENYRVVIITGTNGKTVTTALTVNILKQKFDHVMTNNSGSNMLQGITSSFKTLVQSPRIKSLFLKWTKLHYVISLNTLNQK